MTTESPDMFDPAPPAVRRLNRRPLFVIVLAVAAVMAAIAYTAYQRAKVASLSGETSRSAIDQASARSVLDRAPEAGLIAEDAPPPPAPTDRRRPRVAVPAAQPSAEPPPADDQVYATEWDRWRQQTAQVDQERFQAAKAALVTAPTVTGFGRAAPARTAAGDVASPGMPAAPSLPSIGGLDQLIQTAASAAGAAGQPGQEFAAENNATGKTAWLAAANRPGEYLSATRQPPVSPMEIKAGTVIPGVMIAGINSDLPGQLIAQVRENVYDTVTGKHLLIPQGSRLVGAYDNQVTRGQTRVLVAWNRVIFPDGSSLDLGAMVGSDGAGYSGFRDKVKNHYARVFGNALLMSMFAAAAQLSQPDDQGTAGGLTSGQITSAALGQQLSQTGMAITQRNLNIQPTLTVRPGFRFNVMVTRDIVLDRWGVQ